MKVKNLKNCLLTKKVFLRLAAIFLFFLVLGGIFCYLKVQRFAASPIIISQETLFTLPSGMPRNVLSAQLEKQGIIQHHRVLFFLLMTVDRDLTHVKAGTYRLKKGMSVRQMLALFVSGKEAQFAIRFIEGKTLRDWLNDLREAPYLKSDLKEATPQAVAQALKLDPRRLEGSFYPDTYFYTANTTDIALLNRAYERMTKTVQQIWENRAQHLPYKNAYEMVTMASLIEKETGIPTERGKIASVFINRLRAGMRLQSDPTVIYDLGEKYTGILTRKHLTTAGIYNTYSIRGLPPGPIAMPGRASLKAAANPETTDYFYFVADGKKGHVFSRDLNEHNRAVQAYRLLLKEKNEK